MLSTSMHGGSASHLISFETRDGVRAVVLHGTANRYLKDVFSFVPDDAFCEANIISERRFEIVIHEGYELNTALSGLPLFVPIDTFTGSPTHSTARIDFGARFYDFLGSSSIWIDEAVSPRYVINGVDNISYRGAVEAPAASLSVTAPDGVPAVTPVDADTFRLDWSYPALKAAVDPHTEALQVSAALSGGGTANKSARLVVRAVGLGLTAGDPYEVWPTPGCEPSVYTCVQAQPPNATDFGACGSYREVARCMYASACDVLPPEPLSLTQTAGFGQSVLFSQGYGDGAALLAEIDAFTGGGAIEAWLYTEEAPCHNWPRFYRARSALLSGQRRGRRPRWPLRLRLLTWTARLRRDLMAQEGVPPRELSRASSGSRSLPAP